MPPYPTKPGYPTSSDDDATVDSDSGESLPIPEKQSSSFAMKKRKKRLTTISRKYDLDGDGILDDAEQAMRDRDVANRGFLTNDEIYTIVQEQLRAKKSAGHMKKLIAGLICFVVLLAVSNLGTSLAAAFLAKDLKADDSQGSTMKIAATGEIAAAQSTADTYEAAEMSDEELDERRRLVIREMDEDPHSHAHRRLASSCKNGRAREDKMEACGGGRKVTFDSNYIPEDEFDRILSKCQSQRNVYLKRRWEDDTKNECICSRGTSVVVKEKRNKKGNNNNNKKDKDKNKKDKNKNKKDKNKGRGRDKEVIIEREDGRTMHADCNNGMCYCGGTVLQGDRGDTCRIGGDECGNRLICRPNIARSNGKKLRNNNQSSKYGSCMDLTTTTITDNIARNGGGGGGVGDDCVANPDTCGDGFYCLPYNFNPNGNNGGNGMTGMNGGGVGTAYAQGVIVSGPSGVVNTGSGGNTNGNGSGNNAGARSNSPYTGEGTCTHTVGAGQTCYSGSDCGPGNYCDGMGERVGGTARFELHGDSGSIIVPASGGVIATDGICSSE